MSSKKFVLAVDDSPTVLKLIEGLLTSDKISIETCKNGEEAKQLILRRRFDLIISDEEMPSMNGSELVKWLRKTIANTRTPFVIMSSKNDSRLFAELLSNNFINVMFPKPFHNSTFINIVYALLGIQDIPVTTNNREKK